MGRLVEEKPTISTIEEHEGEQREREWEYKEWGRNDEGDYTDEQ